MRTAWKSGTVLETQSGTRYTITSSNGSGGSAIIYFARSSASSIRAVLKEFFPLGSDREGWSRRNGAAVQDSVLTLPAGSKPLQKCQQQLHDLAVYELNTSQAIAEHITGIWPARELLQVVEITEPDGTRWRPEPEDGGVLPCCILRMDDLNGRDGIWMKDLMNEAAFPQSPEHPLGNLQGVDMLHAVPPLMVSLAVVQHTLNLLYKIHQAGYLHGDINLGNLFLVLGPKGDEITNVMTIDFGCSRKLTDGRTDLICAEQLFTTPGFGAPEIWEYLDHGTSLQLTAAADVYSVGKLLQFLLNRDAANAYRMGLDLEPRLRKATLSQQKTNDKHISADILRRINALLAGAAEEMPEKRLSLPEFLKDIRGLQQELEAPRYLVAEGLSSADYFVPHSRGRELLQLQKQLDAEARPIWIWGLGGLGKTELACAFLRQCKKEGMRVAFFSYEQSVRDTIRNLEFTNYKYTPSKTNLTLEQQQEEEYRAKLNFLAAMGSDSVIVMDNFDSDTQTLDEMRREPAYQELIDLRGPHLIITTRFTPKGHPPVEICPLPKELLLKMMLDIMDEKDDSPSVDTMLGIIEAVQGHTLTCYLIGNALSDPVGDLTAQDVLDALNRYNLHSLTEDVTSDKDRKYTSETIYGHLKILFNMCGMTGAYRAALCHTLLLPQKGLDIKLFRQGESREEQDALRSLIAHGWAQCTCLKENIHLLTIHPLIRELILNELKPTEQDFAPYADRLWEQYDPWDFTKKELQLRIDLLEAALKFLQAGPEQAELHYRLGILWLTQGDCLPPCKDELIFDTRTRTLDAYTTECASLGFEHLKESARWVRTDSLLIKKYSRSECYCSASAISALISFCLESEPWKKVLDCLRFINKSSCQPHDEKNVNGYLDIVFCLKEIQTLITQNPDRSYHRKAFYNNLACVCKVAFEELQKFSSITSEDGFFRLRDAETSKLTAFEKFFLFCTQGYTEKEISEIKGALKNAASLADELLKMAEGGSTELQIAVLENRGSWYSMEENEPTARTYYQKALELAKTYIKRPDAKWISSLYSRIGESYKNEYDRTGKLECLESAINAYLCADRQWPEYACNEIIVDCMIQRARDIYTKDSVKGKIEAEKILDYWRPIVERGKSFPEIDEFIGVFLRTADICQFISTFETDESRRQKYFVAYQRRATEFLEEGLECLEQRYPVENYDRILEEEMVYKRIWRIFDSIFVHTQDKRDEEKKFYYWKKHVDLIELICAVTVKLGEIAHAKESSLPEIIGDLAEKSEVMKLVEELEKAGYLEDAALYRKKAEKLEQEN